MRWLAVVLVVWGTWVNVALATWVQDLKSPGFTELRYRLDDAVFGGEPPSVIDLDRAAPVPRDGVVAIDGDCDGLYIAEQRHWAVLERAIGVRRVHGIAQPAAGNPVVVSAPEGELRIELTHAGDGFTVVWTPVAGDALTGTSQPVDSGQALVEITSDPVTGTLQVDVDGHLVLFTFAAPSLPEATTTGSFTLLDGEGRGTPVCDFLQSRRGDGSSLGARGPA